MKKVICFFSRLEDNMSKPGDEPFFNLEVASRISLCVMSSNLLKLSGCYEVYLYYLIGGR